MIFFHLLNKINELLLNDMVVVSLEVHYFGISFYSKIQKVFGLMNGNSKISFVLIRPKSITF